jgi:hypothetical protein
MVAGVALPMGGSALAAGGALHCGGMSHAVRLPPTSLDLLKDETKPYFLWWTDATIGDFRRYLASPEARERAYWLGALLREANPRDVWLFTSPEAIREHWSDLIPFLGRSRDLWAFLLQLPKPEWPPKEARE